jgi:hypothetical protein
MCCAFIYIKRICANLILLQIKFIQTTSRLILFVSNCTKTCLSSMDSKQCVFIWYTCIYRLYVYIYITQRMWKRLKTTLTRIVLMCKCIYIACELDSWIRNQKSWIRNQPKLNQKPVTFWIRNHVQFESETKKRGINNPHYAQFQNIDNLWQQTSSNAKMCLIALWAVCSRLAFYQDMLPKTK